MEPKEFLDYLVAIGYARRQHIPQRTNAPKFPNQNSTYVPKNSTFFANKIEYTVLIPADNTRVVNAGVVNAGVKEDPLQKVNGLIAEKKKQINSLIAYVMSKLPNKYTQPYGVTFYSPTFGNKNYEGSPYRAEHHGGYIDIDYLLPIMGGFGGIGEGLDFAWALNYLKDLIGELNLLEDPIKEWGKEKEMNIIKKGEIKPLEKKEKSQKENTASHKDLSSKYPQYVKPIEDTTIINRKFEFTIVDTTMYRGTKEFSGFYGRENYNVLVELFSVSGDTVAAWEIIERASGKVEKSLNFVYPGTHMRMKTDHPVRKELEKRYKNIDKENF